MQQNDIVDSHAHLSAPTTVTWLQDNALLNLCSTPDHCSAVISRPYLNNDRAYVMVVVRRRLSVHL